MSFAYHLMGGGYRLGRFLGIDVRVNPTWFVAAGLLFLVFTLQTTGLGLGLFGPMIAALLVVLLFASVLAHEYGHALAARTYGIPTRAITLHGLGGLAQIESDPRRPSDEIVVAAAGPAVSFLLAGAGFVATLIAAVTVPPLAAVISWIAWVNLVLGAFNLLPGLPLDGGRILRGILWARSGDRRRATLTAASWGVRLGQGLMVLGFLGLLGIVAFSGLGMLLVGFFVYGAASSEKRRLEAESRFGPALDGLFRAWRTMSGPQAAAGGARRPPRSEEPADEVVRFPDGREVFIPKSRR